MMIENFVECGPRKKMPEPVACAAAVQVLLEPVVRKKSIDLHRRDERGQPRGVASIKHCRDVLLLRREMPVGMSRPVVLASAVLALRDFGQVAVELQPRLLVGFSL
jgi:hypothetical protein